MQELETKFNPHPLKANSSKLKANSGQLLLEILVAIAVGAIVLGVGGTLIYVNLSGTKGVGERDQAHRLAEETFDIVRSVSLEKWKGAVPNPVLGGIKGLYDFDKGSDQLHYIAKTGWDTESGVEKPYKWIDHTPAAGVRWCNSPSCTRAVSGVAGDTLRNIWIALPNSNVWQWDGENWTRY